MATTVPNRSPLIVSPHLYLADVTGRPLDYGMVYFGKPNEDGEFYPINIFSDKELSKPLSQPVYTKGGFLHSNGDMVEVFAYEGVYSVKVLDQYGRKIFYKAEVAKQTIEDAATDVVDAAQVEINKRMAQLDEIIKTVAAAGAGANGWTTDLVVENGLTQKQINSRTDYVNALNYLTKAEINDLGTATPVLDHTKSLQKAIDASVAQGKKCFIPRMTGAYNIKIEPDAWTALPNDKVASGFLAYNYRAGLILNTGCHLVFGANTQLKAITTDCWAGVGLCVVGDNVTIEGNNSMFLGERLTHNYTSVKIPASKPTAEWVTGLSIAGANVNVLGLQFKDWTGDCIGVSSNEKLRFNNPNMATVSPALHFTKDVTIKNCMVDGARRNNISVTDCDGFLIDNCVVKNAGYTDVNGITGINPKLGIDLEPWKPGNTADGYDTAEIVQNGTVSNCRFVENRAGDVTAYNVYNVKIINNHCTATINNGYSTNTVIANNVVDMSIARTNSLDGTNGRGTGIASIGIPITDRFNHFNNSLITGNILYGCAIGIDIRGRKNKVTNNILVNCESALYCYGALDLSVEDNFILSPTKQGINILVGTSSTESNMVVVKGNIVQDFTGSEKAIFLSATAETTLFMSDNILSNCVRGMEIKGTGLYNVSITNNTFNKVQQTYVGAWAVLLVEAATKNCIIENNTFFDSLAFFTPIAIKGKAIIRANKFLDCAANLMLNITASNTRVIDNVFEFNGTANGGQGVNVASTANNVVITGNRFFSANSYKFDADINTANSTNNTIANNFITSKVQSSTTDITHGNVVLGKVYKATATYDPPSLATATQQSTTVTLTGATVGETVAVSFDKPLQGTRIWAEVTSTNTVTVYHRNDTAAAVDLASGTLTVKIV